MIVISSYDGSIMTEGRESTRRREEAVEGRTVEVKLGKKNMINAARPPFALSPFSDAVTQ